MGWAECRDEVRFLKNYSLVQTLLSLRLREPSKQEAFEFFRLSCQKR